jgi:hypothetical protein
MLKHGIPKNEKLKINNDQQTAAEFLLQQQIERMAKFVNVPLSDLTSANQGLNGYSNEILSDEDAEKLLKEVDIRKITEGWSMGATKRFNTLDQVQMFIRQETILPGNRRLDSKKILSLRLWAALSDEPLPVFDLQEYQDRSKLSSTTTTAPPPRKNSDKSEPKPTETISSNNTGSNVDTRGNGRATAASRVSDISANDNDYKSMSIEEIEELTKRDEQKLQNLVKENVRKQKKKVSEINDIITRIQDVEKKLDDFQQQKNNNPTTTPLLRWKATMEWEEIAQAHQQATNKLERLKSKLSALGKKRKAVIGQHQKQREEICRVQQKLQHPLAHMS